MPQKFVFIQCSTKYFQLFVVCENGINFITYYLKINGPFWKLSPCSSPPLFSVMPKIRNDIIASMLSVSFIHLTKL